MSDNWNLMRLEDWMYKRTSLDINSCSRTCIISIRLTGLV